ncbi:hypothetical protein [Marinobacter maroccanus]|uniref:hypothetical protein n=1 Tax=Marinobacter maroccanus TaxID=2055143 RepID=UPI001F5426E9|nr:hypothetical protein [Marinobacter maroccanus]
MENYLNLMIIGATRYDIDGNRGGSLWAYSPAEADDDNRVGNTSTSCATTPATCQACSRLKPR